MLYNRYLHVDGVHFLAVPAVLTLVQLLNEYVSLCKDRRQPVCVCVCVCVWAVRLPVSHPL